MINYEFKEELQILEVTYSGEIFPEDLVRYGEEIASNKALPDDVLRILTDVSAAIYRIYPRDYDELKHALASHVERYSMVRAAFVQDKPRETALSMMFSQQIGLPKYVHKVFSEREPAINWLLMF